MKGFAREQPVIELFIFVALIRVGCLLLGAVGIEDGCVLGENGMLKLDLFKIFVFLALKNGVKALFLHFFTHFINIGIEFVVLELVFVCF